jgi:GNAT superfamily N-acetyltransferase
VTAVPMPVVRTHLELTHPGELRPAAPPRTDRRVDITRVAPADGATSAWFYEHVGGAYSWTDHADRSPAEWQAWADEVETWLLTVDGHRAGYYELKDHGDAIEIAYFGLLRDHHGKGLGGHLLTHAIGTAQTRHARVTVHTCTLDGPHALANYEARGFRPVRTEVIEPD